MSCLAGCSAARWVQASKIAQRHKLRFSLHARWTGVSPFSCSCRCSDAPSETRTRTTSGRSMITARCRAVWQRIFTASTIPTDAAAAARRRISSRLLRSFIAKCSILRVHKIVVRQQRRDIGFLRAKAARLLSLRLSHRKSVRPSVSLSVTRVVQSKRVQIFYRQLPGKL